MHTRACIHKALWLKGLQICVGTKSLPRMLRAMAKLTQIVMVTRYFSLVYMFLNNGQQPVLRCSFANASPHVKGHRDAHVKERVVIALASANAYQNLDRARISHSMTDHLLHDPK